MNMIDYETKAKFFQMLAHPVRLQILDEIRRRPACVCHLQEVTGRPQAYVSQQLRLLRESKLVNDEKDGQNVFYHLSDETLLPLLREILGPPGEPSHPADCTCPFCTR